MNPLPPVACASVAGSKIVWRPAGGRSSNDTWGEFDRDRFDERCPTSV
jgi:hypothetical protein